MARAAAELRAQEERAAQLASEQEAARRAEREAAELAGAAKPRQEYISRKREEFAVAGSQTATHAFGTPYLRSCSLDAVLSWIAFLFICWPIGVVLVLSGCCGPLLFQRFAMWCLTGPLRNSLLGVLLMRIPSLTYDLAMNGYQFLFQGFEQRMWTDTLLPARREYLDANFGRNLMLWDTCPGEEHAVAVISIVVGAFLDYHKPAGGGPPENTRTAGDAEATSEPRAALREDAELAEALRRSEVDAEEEALARR
ncbi:hypothetical protein EMIHUDRAFT_356543, partial [Emiliania huxleyi CCMP1516]|uniref:Uncharacterized protein n=2 Tax=Emiliania huxleyi TaxID=2903 RepID=A0A0D3ISV2_EMIH1